MGVTQNGQVFGGEAHLDAARDAWLAADPKWAAPIPDQQIPSTSPPKSHNHCAEELANVAPLRACSRSRVPDVNMYPLLL